jgi:hypothetical protein
MCVCGKNIMSDSLELFGVLLARILEDDLSHDIETGLMRQCLLIAREPTLRVLQLRIAEERAMRVFARQSVLPRLERLAQYVASRDAD